MCHQACHQALMITFFISAPSAQRSQRLALLLVHASSIADAAAAVTAAGSRSTEGFFQFLHPVEMSRSKQCTSVSYYS